MALNELDRGVAPGVMERDRMGGVMGPEGRRGNVGVKACIIEEKRKRNVIDN